jgi:hypothetical protein
VTESSENHPPMQAQGEQMPAWIAALVILGVSLLVIVPLLIRGNSCGHDFNFHLLSWMEVARAWHSGLVYPHWVEDANYGAGEPRLIFYPPASWILGAGLGCAATWAAAPILLVLLALLGGGASMYFLAREWVGKESALLAACLYVANPYALFVVYERSAFGELLAGAVLPLVVLFALRRTPSTAVLGAAMAAVWLSDAPAAVMASYMLAVIALVMTLLERKAWPALRAAGGMTLGLALAAFYIVPAAAERGWVEIARVISPGMRVEDSFLFEHTSDSLHDQVLRTASWIFIAEIAVAAGAAWLAAKRPTASHARIALTSLLPLILFLQFPASDAVWRLAPQLKFLQFPWRWLLVVGVAACALLAMALDRRKMAAGRDKFSWGRRAAVGLAVVALVAGGERTFFQPCDDEDAVAARLAVFRAGPTAAGVEGTDEYTPRGADNSAIQQELPFVRVLKGPQDDEVQNDDSSQTENPEWRPDAAVTTPANLSMREWNAEHWTLRIESAAGGYAVLRLMDYPAWQVTLNGKTVARRPQRDDGLMTIPLIAGDNAIAVRWRTTRGAIAGFAITAAALLVLISLALNDRRREKRTTAGDRRAGSFVM